MFITTISATPQAHSNLDGFVLTKAKITNSSLFSYKTNSGPTDGFCAKTCDQSFPRQSWAWRECVADCIASTN